MPVRCGTGRCGRPAVGGLPGGVSRASAVGLAATPQAVEQPFELGAYRFVVLTAQVAAQLYGHVERAEGYRAGPEDFSDEALRAITVDRTLGGLASADEPEAGGLAGIEQRPRDEALARDSHAGPQDGLELRGLAQYRGPRASCHMRGSRGYRVAYTARRARPLARRALMMARPLLVFMRARKPWVRARRVFDGW